jgi:hypothetical protein
LFFADSADGTGAVFKRCEEGWDLSTRVNPTGELREPLPIWEANRALGQLDLFKPTQVHRDDMQ